MSSTVPPTRIRRSTVQGSVIVCAALLCTAGCGSGFNAASLNVKPDSGSAQLGGIRVNNVVVVTDPATRAAEVIAAVANTGSSSDQLVSVTAAGSTATVRPAAQVPPAAALPLVGVTVAGNTVTIEGGSAVSFGQPGRPELEIPDGNFTPGHFTQVELGFANAGQATVNALVMSNTGLYESYNPNGANQPSSLVSPSSSTGPNGSNVSPTPTPTLAPSATASPTSSPTAGAGSVALAKASTTLARTPHLYGSREPRR